MTKTRSVEPGVDEWSCTRCSRRLLLRRPPAFEKIVLDPGDEDAAHVGSAGGSRITEAHVQPLPAANLPEWAREWLADNGMEW